MRINDSFVVPHDFAAAVTLRNDFRAIIALCLLGTGI
jgi:hypothetical protein